LDEKELKAKKMTNKDSQDMIDDLEKRNDEYLQTKIKLIKKIQKIINNMTVSELDYLIQELSWAAIPSIRRL